MPSSFISNAPWEVSKDTFNPYLIQVEEGEVARRSSEINVCIKSPFVHDIQVQRIELRAIKKTVLEQAGLIDPRNGIWKDMRATKGGSSRKETASGIGNGTNVSNKYEFNNQKNDLDCLILDSVQTNAPITIFGWSNSKHRKAETRIEMKLREEQSQSDLFSGTYIFDRIRLFWEGTAA